MAQSTPMQSLSTAARKQIGLQPEIIRNSDKHAALPTHDLYADQQAMFQDSKSKHWYPDVSVLCPDSRSYKITTVWSVNPVKIQSNYMWPVKAELKKKSQGSTLSHKYRQANTKGTLNPHVKLDL